MTNLTNNKAVLSWIDEMTAITKPDKIVWITGEEEQLDALREQAVKEGILIKLNPDKLPGCYLHRTDPDDVARVEDRTFICCEKEEDAGPTNHWVEPKEMYEKMYALADGAYKGRTMYIIPYSMSIIGSPFAKYGFELTDSIYVVLNMHIMTRIGKAVCLTAFLFALALGGVELLAFFTLLRPYVLPLFSLSAGAAAMCAVMVYCYAGVMPLHGFSSTMVVGVLRGGGDVRASLLIDNFPLWCVELPLMCLLGLVLKVPNEMFCLCIAIEHLAKTPVGLWRIHSGKWVHDITRSE